MNIRNHLRNFALLAGAALLSTGAMADPFNSAVIKKTETIKYSAPEAHTAAGAAALYKRLSDAASQVCSATGADAAYYPAIDSYGSYESCFTKALDKAVRKVNITSVTALYLEHNSNNKLASTAMPVTEETEVLANR
jgi:UrcA family protein